MTEWKVGLVEGPLDLEPNAGRLGGRGGGREGKRMGFWIGVRHGEVECRSGWKQASLL